MVAGIPDQVALMETRVLCMLPCNYTTIAKEFAKSNGKAENI